MNIERWTRMELIFLLNRARSFKIVSNASLTYWNYLPRIIEKVCLCSLCGEHDRNQSSPTRIVFIVSRLYGFPSTFLASTKNSLNALDSSVDSMLSRVFWNLFSLLQDKNWTKIIYRSSLVNRLWHKKKELNSKTFTGIFYGFFSVSWNGTVNQHFNFSVKKIFFAFHDQLKVYLERLLVSWFFFLSKLNQTTDIKLEGRYPLITIVRFCITWSVLSNEIPQKLIGGL